MDPAAFYADPDPTLNFFFKITLYSKEFSGVEKDKKKLLKSKKTIEVVQMTYFL